MIFSTILCGEGHNQLYWYHLEWFFFLSLLSSLLGISGPGILHWKENKVALTTLWLQGTRLLVMTATEGQMMTGGWNSSLLWLPQRLSSTLPLPISHFFASYCIISRLLQSATCLFHPLVISQNKISTFSSSPLVSLPNLSQSQMHRPMSSCPNPTEYG